MALGGMPLPGLAQWATGGTARIGEISDLFDSDSVYFVARLDSLVPGGEAPLAKVRNDSGVRKLTSTPNAFAASAVMASVRTTPLT